LNLAVPKDMLDDDFLIGMQSDPNIVGQLIAYQMVKLTPSWPPESLAAAVQIGKTMNMILGNITPSVPVYEFVEDVEEEGDQEEGI